MLVALYIISATAGVFTYVFEELEKFKQRAICLVIAILTGITFCIPMITTIIDNITNVDFWSVFAVLSLITWQFAFISGDVANVLNYIFAAILFAATLWLLCTTFSPSDDWETCNEKHVTTEIIPILTSINKSASIENVYGEGFIIRCVHDISSNKITYQYYRIENEEEIESEFPGQYTTIHYIEDNESPYLEIITTMHCSSYSPTFDKHLFIGCDKIYNLYVPKNSILDVISSDLN